MDPLTALSLAGNIVQFVDFAAELLKEGRSLYKSRTGTLLIHEELKLTTNDLQTLIAEVRRYFPKKQETDPLHDEEAVNDEEAVDDEEEAVEGYTFEQICDKAAEIAEEIVEQLDKLKVEGSENRKWKSIKQALKKQWKEKKLNALIDRLSRLKDALQSRILFSVRESLDAESIRTSARFDSLDKQTQRIITTILDSTSNVSNSFREQIVAFTCTLSQLVSRLEAIADSKDNEMRGAECGRNQANRSSDITADIEMFDVPYEQETRLRGSIASSILNALYYPSMTERYEDVVEAYPQTFDWIYQESMDYDQPWDNFPQWLSTGNGVYWISGKAGSGKSTLMKHIFDNDRTRDCLIRWANQNPLCIASFFFWNNGVHEQKSQSGLLRALLHQVLTQYSDLIPIVFPAEWTSQYSAAINHTELPLTQWSPQKLITAFKALIAQHLIPVNICFLIDGLDEFEGDDGEHEKLIDLFKTTSTMSTVKVCFSSRPWVIFEDSFSSGPHLRLHHLTCHDIELFISGKLIENARFQRLAAREPKMAQALIHEIMDSASGVFLWVYLVVRSLLQGLRNHDDIATLQSRLRLLPKDLEPLYSHLLSLIEPCYEEWASRALQIVRLSLEYAKHPFGASNRIGEGPLPPSIAEFYIAIMKEDELCLLQDMSLEELSTRCQETEIHLTARCAGLIEVRNPGGSSADCFLRRLQFLHKTVEDFLAKVERRPEILTKTEGTDFNPNFSMLRACSIASSMKYNSLLTSEESIKRQYLLGVMIYAYHLDKDIKAQEIQMELLDRVNENLFLRTGKGYLSAINTNYGQDLDSFLGLATIFDLRHYVFKKLSKCSARTLEQTSSKLLQLLSRNCGENQDISLPLPTAEMVSLLMKFNADPHYRYQSSTAWQNIMDFIKRTSMVKSSELDTVAYLRMMKVFGPFIPDLLSYENVKWSLAAVSAWRELTQTTLRTYPNETKEVLHELELRIPRATLDKHPTGWGGYRHGSQSGRCAETDTPATATHSIGCNKRRIGDVSEIEEEDKSREKKSAKAGCQDFNYLGYKG